MNKIIYVVLLISVCFINSCTPNSPTNTGTPTPFTLKYEIITSSPIVSNPTSQEIGYTNGTGQVEFDNSFNSGTTWTKEITVTTPTRPFNIALVSNGTLILTPGTATGNIYINGNQVAHVVNPSPAVISMGYSVK